MLYFWIMTQYILVPNWIDGIDFLFLSLISVHILSEFHILHELAHSGFNSKRILPTQCCLSQLLAFIRNILLPDLPSLYRPVLAARTEHGHVKHAMVAAMVWTVKRVLAVWLISSNRYCRYIIYFNYQHIIMANI